MTDLRAAAQAVLDCWDSPRWRWGTTPTADLMNDLRAALEAPKPCLGRDPLCPCQDGDACHYKDTATTKGWPVQAQLQPLSDEQIDALAMDDEGLPNSHLEFARAIEAAHGIKP